MTRILVVEDDPWIQWMIADDLAERGYEVVTAQDGVEALASIGTVRPDVIVLDLILPRCSGWDVAERYPTQVGDVIPIVVVSAARDRALPAASHGVRRYLPKPFDIDELAQAVAELSGRYLAATPT